MPRLQYVLRGIRSEEARLNRQPRQRLPVTIEVLRKIHSILLLDPNNFDNIMLWAAFLLCFFGFLRSGEVTIPDQNSYDPQVHLNFQDISADNPTSPSLLSIRIKASKTDPFRQGVSIKTNNSLCPVSAILAYLVARGTKPGLLFYFKDGTPLTKARFTQNFRQLLTQAKIDCSLYAGHSFRIGAATTALTLVASPPAAYPQAYVNPMIIIAVRSTLFICLNYSYFAPTSGANQLTLQRECGRMQAWELD